MKKRILTIITILIVAFIPKTAYADMFDYKYMAHAAGGYEGEIYNNTKVAFRNSIESGFKFIEVDMLLTADDELVCFHGWDEKTYEYTDINFDGVPTLSEFNEFRVQGKYKPMTAKDVINFMKIYDDLYVEIDLKKSNYKDTQKMIRQLIEICDYDEDILDRILMQFTSETAFFAIDEIYTFKHYQYFTYKSTVVNDINNIIEFCKDNNVQSIAINYTVLNDELISKVKNNDFKLLVFTIDDIETAEDIISKGANTICTNFIK